MKKDRRPFWEREWLNFGKSLVAGIMGGLIVLIVKRDITREGIIICILIVLVVSIIFINDFIKYRLKND